MFNTDFFIFQYLFPITIGNILQFSQMKDQPKLKARVAQCDEKVLLLFTIVIQGIEIDMMNLFLIISVNYQPKFISGSEIVFGLRLGQQLFHVQRAIACISLFFQRNCFYRAGIIEHWGLAKILKKFFLRNISFIGKNIKLLSLQKATFTD